MSIRQTIAPYGSWKSPITADRIVEGGVGLGQVALDGSDIYWSEMRPAEGGRHVILRWREGTVEEILPAPFSARTRVHEYGGGAFAVDEGVLYFSNDNDQLLYRLAPGNPPHAITTGTEKRYADAVIDRRHHRLLCVGEDHSVGGEPVNTIVAIDLEGQCEARVLVAGQDFYASPRLSPDGRQLAWLSWNHPDMPWDGTELWLADMGPDGLPVNPQCVAGNREESVFQPLFAPDGTLYFVSDRSNWWNLYRLQQGRVKALAPMEAEFGLPQWIFGLSTYAFDSAQRLVCTFNRAGAWHLAVLDTSTLRMEEIETPFSDISHVTAADGMAIFVAASATLPAAIVRLDLVTHQYEILRASLTDIPESGYLSAPQTLTYPTAHGDTAHAWYYPPTNQDFHATADSMPPLLVLSHGGPTSAASSSLNLRIQYWTSRGFAVVDVNYRGSTGYGRAYRHRLDGQWGVADVEDCMAAAQHIVERGLADKDRLAIRGGSAGGYTTLCALTFHRLFRVGAAYYGVSDLEALVRDTHKFEARYLDRLIGPYPASRDLYLERSPIHHVDRLSSPVIFFQGLEDKVVPPDQTEKMVNALRARHIPVAYVPFEGEQHGFRRAENIRRALEAEFYFYSRLFGFTPADSIMPVTIENLQP
ncbi:MAG: S9 family peptidase [Sulfuricaulis sp.]|uniref:S9 family peptidase n=1 Tax=Sulfuricaulis sp. TaxID=2003553 RepID=UPI0025FB1E0F|nr:S9 family peptidase [Sulfuricaulis sp.]MCR4346973.1 S9 family peptidase [Sulfuricaulis sp.]